MGRELDRLKARNEGLSIIMGYSLRMTIVVVAGVILLLVVAGFFKLDSTTTMSALGTLGTLVGYVHHTSARKRLGQADMDTRAAATPPAATESTEQPARSKK